MIRPIDIRLNAAHPELPLAEAVTFTGSPSTVLIRGVPPNCGRWAITAVFVAASFPDGSTTTRAAVQSANGVWVATLPATATSGRTANGVRVMADGIDENGEAVTGYILGVADFAVLSFTPVPAPGGTFWLLRYFDAVPATPKKGDAAIVGGILKYYNGAAWLPFADLTNYYTKAETDNAIERVAAYYITANAQGSNFATRADLINATTYYSGGVVRVPTRNDYAVVLADETHDGAEYRYIYAVADGATTGQWEAQYPIETNDYIALSNKPQINGNTLTGEGSQSGEALGLLDLSGGIMQGDLGVNGHDIDITNAGRVIVRGINGYVAIFANDGIEFSTDDSMTWTHFDWPSASGTFALTADLRYALTSKTISNNAVTLDDRAINAVAVSSALASLTVNFPTATSGKVRDFGLRLTVASGVTTAPQIVLPQGVTCENADGAAPEIGADGAATILYFTETASGVFLVKGEVVQTIS